MGTQTTLENMTVKQLREVAYNNGIVGVSKKPKMDIIQDLIDYLKVGLSRRSKKYLKNFAEESSCFVSSKLRKEEMIDKIINDVVLID